MKFSANISTLFADLPSLTARYKYVALKCGHLFDAIECQDPYQVTVEEWKKTFQECQSSGGKVLKWDLINSPFLFKIYEPGSVPTKEEYQEKFLSNVEKYAKFFNCSMVHLIMADLDKRNREESRQKMIDLLVFGADYMERRQIKVVIEPLSTRPDYYLNSYPMAAELVKKYPSNLKVLLDFYHLQRLSGNITENIECLSPLVGHVQFSQVPLRDGPCCPGELDHDYIFRTLAPKYNGYIGCEYKNETKDSLEWIETYASL